MIWGAISKFETADLYFQDTGTTMNDQIYVEILSDKIEIHMVAAYLRMIEHHATNHRKGKNILRLPRWNDLATALTTILQKICRIT